MNLLTKEQILSATDYKTEDVPVPEWGGTARVRTISGRERDAFEASLSVGSGTARKVNTDNIRARLVAMCVIDEAGARLFSDSEVLKLGEKSATALDRVFTVAQRLNALSQAEVEDIAKNSEAAPSGASTSA